MKRGIILLSLLGLTLLWFACKKEAEKPPVNNLFMWTKYSVKQLTSIASCTGTCQKRFTRDAYFTGVVIADELSGNFYKEIYVRDTYDYGFSGGAIHLDFMASHCNFFVGDSIRMNLKGYDVNFNDASGLLEIDSIDFEKAVVKYGTGPSPKPIQLKLSELDINNPLAPYYCDLVTISDVSFIEVDKNKIYADPISQLSINRTISDCQLNPLLVRTSNYAKFAQERTPSGSGSITGIATAYRGVDQMAIRNTGEVLLSNSPCTAFVKKDFEDLLLASGGWTQVAVTNPSVTWQAGTYNSQNFGKISGYLSGNKNSESWLISPAINLSSTTNPILSFNTAAKFAGNALEVWVSSNYVSGLPASATWTLLSGYKLSENSSDPVASNYIWTRSGDVSLNAYKFPALRIAFKYKSTTSGASTYEIDNIVVKD